MTTSNNDRTFVKITNKDIYDAIMQTKEQLVENSKEHAVIMEHQKRTNGKVKANRVMIYSIFSFIGGITLFLIVAALS